jgi:hypothetical protein
MHFAISAGCLNEREWQQMIKDGGNEEIAKKLEGCLAGIGVDVRKNAIKKVQSIL